MTFLNRAYTCGLPIDQFRSLTMIKSSEVFFDHVIWCFSRHAFLSFVLRIASPVMWLFSLFIIQKLSFNAYLIRNQTSQFFFMTVPSLLLCHQSAKRNKGSKPHVIYISESQTNESLILFCFDELKCPEITLFCSKMKAALKKFSWDQFVAN